MSKFIDLTGQKFNKLTVIKKNNNNTKDGNALWECVCDCGKTVVVCGKEIRSGHTKSCGCLRKEQVRECHKTHGKSNTKLFSVWQSMLKRCYRKYNKDYSNYGGRGITVCREWQNDFQAFYDWALANGYRDDLTIDRIDVNGNYEPLNCRWITQKEQCNNRRTNSFITYEGRTQTIQQWADELGINRQTLRCRIYKLNWGIEKAFKVAPKK